MIKNKFLTIGYGIIIVLVIIWLLTKVQFIFKPIVVTVQTLFIPFLLAGVLFYILRPLVDLMTNVKIPRVLAIVIIYVLFIALITGISLVAGPLLQQQIEHFVEQAPHFADVLLQQWDYLQAEQGQLPSFVNDWIESATATAQTFLQGIGRNMMTVISEVAGFVIGLVVIPFILFYMLKDGHHLADHIVRFLPAEQRMDAKNILGDMNKALNTYVLGQVIVSLCVGTMVFIWYVIIGLDYSLILALVAMLTNVIPFIGPFIGTIPAVIVGLMDSPTMMLLVLLGVVIAQQIESNLISPQVMGRALDVHPLTIILLIMVAGSLAGFMGLILAVPAYAVAKVIVKHGVRLYRLRRQT